MKRKILILIFTVIIVALLIVPSFGVMLDSLGSSPNLFDPSDLTSLNFYTSKNTFQKNVFYSVYLDSSKTYTFLSTEGTKRFYVGESVSYNDSQCLFSFDSWNLSRLNTYSYSSSYFYEETYLCNIDSPGTYYIGINDVNSGSTSKLFSGSQSSSNAFYLLEGTLSFSDLTDSSNTSSYNSGYNSGYDSGYAVGETDGLSASKSLSSMVFSVLSAPFVIVSNTLNFEILGINILNLVKVILTILLIAFVITRLKGRE